MKLDVKDGCNCISEEHQRSYFPLWATTDDINLSIKLQNLSYSERMMQDHEAEDEAPRTASLKEKVLDYITSPFRNDDSGVTLVSLYAATTIGVLAHIL